MGKKQKKPCFATVFGDLQSKRPALQSDLTGYMTKSPAWRLRSIDDAWDYGWSKIGQQRWRDEVLPKLASFETMTWAEILQNNNSHFVRLDNFNTDARKRLEELCLGDLDQILSLRLRGTYRIYGFCTENILHILWFDFNHELVPSTKKHT